MRPPATTFSLNGNMPGRRCLDASAASGTRWPTTRGDPTARKAPTRSCAIVANDQLLQHRIGYLLKRPVGRPSNEVRRFHANFTYQAGSWTKPRRVIAKVEWHPG